ncbi:NAD-dependent epimerase/dehydratase family protein [Streptomyces cyaneofuscatus]|uniref:NAD-dependent epimerase/dehydratase family protein n=1 Tax=Streptomyces cyaneofuscatus TaxID=66883 RepID=UPI00382086F4
MTVGRTVLLLGGTGFLGRAIGAAFEAGGARVLSAARGGPLRLDLTRAGAEDLAALLRAHPPDVVVNAAGRAWRATDEEMYAANAHAVVRLVEAMAGLPDRPRLIQLGSVHEYGAGVVGAGLREDHPPAPVTAYGRSKLRGSQAVLDGVRTANLDGIVLRLANVCGPGAPAGSLLGAVGARLARAGSAPRAADDPVVLRVAPLRARRDFVDVRDVAEAVVAAAGLPGTGPAEPVINIGLGEALDMRELVERLAALSGLPVRIVEAETDGPLRADVEWQRLDVSKARLLLGWRPRRGVDRSLGDLLAVERAAAPAARLA